MTKKETIWRYILIQSLQRHTVRFTQKNLAAQFGFSTSTIFNALRAPRQLSAIEVTGRFFRLRNFEKLLLLWATQRNLKKDIIYQTHADAPVREIEGSMPPDVIFGAFSAYRFTYKEAPADYSSVYVYTSNPEMVQKRFPKNKGSLNLFVLKSDSLLSSFGKTTPAPQTFVDLWNISDWYAKDFLEALRQKLPL